MTAKKTGILIHFDEIRRRELILERVDGIYESFSDALSVQDWAIGQLSIALLCFSENTIDYIALAKKGNRVVTSKSRVEFSSIVDLKSIPMSAIESKLSTRLQRYFIKASQGSGGVIPETTWHSLIDAIKTERANLAADIDRLFSLRRFSGYRLLGESAEILIQEREALGISLDIFSGSNQLRERVLSEWAPKETSVNNVDEAVATANLTNLEAGKSAFLKGIPQRYLQEESAIQHDLFNWPGMTPTNEAGLSIFIQGERKLEVIYANRNDLEHTLGVDLIYYNENYKLFILIQYKLMREENNKILYRPDTQLEIELKKMNDFHQESRPTATIQTHNDYRLNDDGFMFKFVPNKGLRPATGELIKGMYVTREYMNFLLSPNGPKGPNGGSQITFENAPRYLTNSQFATSVHDGWLGSRGVETQTIKRMIENFYETGKALVVAYESKLNTTISLITD